MYTNLNRKGWVYVSKNKNEMPRQESNNSQGQGSHGAPGKGGKKPGPQKPKNIGKTIKTLIIEGIICLLSLFFKEIINGIICAWVIETIMLLIGKGRQKT